MKVPTEEELRSYWDDFAADFDERSKSTSRLTAAAMVAHLNLSEAEHVVDVGCGPGHGTAMLAQQLPPEAELAACDLSSAMVDITRRRLMAEAPPSRRASSVDLRSGVNAESLPYADGAFDRYLSCFVVQP